MARYTQAQCRLCRREGQKLFLKGARCYGPKCSVDKKGYAPGMHVDTMRRRKPSDYGIQLREKQKARRIYGVLERQFRRYFREATRTPGITGENLLRLLELRLDNVVYRSGFASSRPEARQLVRHRHFTVNGRVVDVPSYQVRPGDVIQVRPKSHQATPILQATATAPPAPANWLDVDTQNFTARVIGVPNREDIDSRVEEQLIVEFYSR
jgi:small subunit ribosomal protein S4